MADSVTVPLSRTYSVHGAEFSSVVLRAPKLKDLMAIGEPYEVQRVNGSGIVIEHLDRFEEYLKRLAVNPTADALNDIELSDAIAVKEAMGGFFTEARAALSKRLTSSSLDTGAA